MPAIDSPAIEVTYVGGPTAVLRAAGVRFITDPTFDAAGGEYKSGAISLHKTVGPGLRPEDLGPIDVALVSHAQHADNLDDSGRALLRHIPVVLTTKPSAQQLGDGAIGLAPGDTHTIRTANGLTLRVTATPARHGPVGIEKATGQVIGFVITVVESGEDLAYVTGDTVWYEGTAQVARDFHPRIVLPFVGGAMTARGPIYLTMNTNDTISLAAAFPDAKLIPVHHDGWTHFTQSQQDLQKAFTAVGLGDRLQWVEAGKSYLFKRTANSGQ